MIFKIKNWNQNSKLNLIVFALLFFYLNALLLRLIIFQLNWNLDWEPTDGDHLNFSRRIAANLPIYLDPKNGTVLSVYNPFYHLVLNAVYGGNQNFIRARFLALIFFCALCILLIIQVWRHTYNWQRKILLILIFFPPIDNLTLDFLQISPSSMLALLFLSTGIMYASNQSKLNIIFIVFISFLSFLTFCTKQQGIVLFAIIFLCLSINEKSKKFLFLYTLSFLFFCLLFYLFYNHLLAKDYNLFEATLVEPKNIIITYWKLGILRFTKTCFLFMPIVLFHFYQRHKSGLGFKKLDFWEASILLHIPFLLYVLQNGGGGANYFATLWISIFMFFVKELSKYRDLKDESKSLKKPYMLKILNYSLVIWFILAVTLNFNTFHNIRYPNFLVKQNMMTLESRISDEVKNLGKCNALANRNIGVILDSQCKVDLEGSATFQSAWNKRNSINKKFILDNIKSKNYQIILTGIQPFPPDIESSIDRHYILVFDSTVNLYFGNTGVQKLFVPKS